MMVPLELRMTASQWMAHPTDDTIDLQTEIAWDRLHPVCLQSVPTEPGASQKLSVTWHPAATAASSPVASSSSSLSTLATLLVSSLDSGLGSNAHAYTPMSDTTARQLIKLHFPMVTSCASECRPPRIGGRALVFCRTSAALPGGKAQTGLLLFRPGYHFSRQLHRVS
jgi:hypothetical protein